MKVLVAEDNLFSRRMLKTILQSAEYTVVEAADGNEAWNEIQKENAPRLLILDWMMPGISGLDLCRQIAEKEKGQTVPARPRIHQRPGRRDFGDGGPSPSM